MRPTRGRFSSRSGAAGSPAASPTTRARSAPDAASWDASTPFPRR
jgi:hypothetical protein